MRLTIKSFRQFEKEAGVKQQVSAKKAQRIVKAVNLVIACRIHVCTKTNDLYITRDGVYVKVLPGSLFTYVLDVLRDAKHEDARRIRFDIMLYIKSVQFIESGFVLYEEEECTNTAAFKHHSYVCSLETAEKLKKEYCGQDCWETSVSYPSVSMTEIAEADIIHEYGKKGAKKILCANETYAPTDYILERY